MQLETVTKINVKKWERIFNDVYEIKYTYKNKKNEKMKIREATKKMLWEIRTEKTKRDWENGHRTKDHEIANDLNITATTFSRLITGCQTPSIYVWARITKKYKEYFGKDMLNNIISKTFYDD